MRYQLMVKATKNFEAGIWPDEKTLAAMAKWTEALVQAGAMLACERLTPSSQGTRVRYADRKITVTDGPFPETKELIAGICLIQARSLDEAVGWARRIPFQDGEVEVRPLLELFDISVDPAERPNGRCETEEQMQAAPAPARKPGTSKYMALIRSDVDVEAGNLPGEQSVAAMSAFLEEGAKAGVFLSGEGLQPSSKGARVRYSGDQRSVIDGPFAETKELVAGYCLLQFASKAEAIDWAKRFVQVDAPGRYRNECECEIRPVFDLEQFGQTISEQFRQAGAR